MSNIYLKVTIEKSWFSNFVRTAIRSVFGELQLTQISLLANGREGAKKAPSL